MTRECRDLRRFRSALMRTWIPTASVRLIARYFSAGEIINVISMSPPMVMRAPFTDAMNDASLNWGSAAKAALARTSLRIRSAISAAAEDWTSADS